MLNRNQGHNQAGGAAGADAECGVIVLHDQEQPLGALAPALQSLGLAPCRARSCAEFERMLAQATAPQLVFADTVLPDGTWADALQPASRAPVPVNVIVVARFVNIRFYVEVIERGAFDFLTPPFVTSDLSHVVRCATANILGRQLAQARPA